MKRWRFAKNFESQHRYVQMDTREVMMDLSISTSEGSHYCLWPSACLNVYVVVVILIVNVYLVDGVRACPVACHQDSGMTM